jgi:hypothetical protein
MKIRLLLALPGLAIGLAVPALIPVLAQTPTPAPTTTLAPTPEATPTPTLGDNVTQVLPDRKVTFRLLAPKAKAVDVVVGMTSGAYEPQGTTTAAMTKDAKGLCAIMRVRTKETKFLAQVT